MHLDNFRAREKIPRHAIMVGCEKLHNGIRTRIKSGGSVVFSLQPVLNKVELVWEREVLIPICLQINLYNRHHGKTKTKHNAQPQYRR